MMAYYFGLYFGDTNLCIAVYRDGKSEVLANAAGDRVTPAFVALSNGEKLVGLAAKQGMVRNSTNTLTRIKTVISGNEEDIDNVNKNSRCKLIKDGEWKYELSVDGKTKLLAPYEALVSLFRNMADIAKSNCHEIDIPAVVTVPLSFGEKPRRTIKSAAMDAGFRLLRVISEPSAAILAYDIGYSSDETYNCLVYRLGGYSLDVTLVRVLSGVYYVLDTVRDASVGGGMFTTVLADFCANEFKRQYKVDITENNRTVIKVKSACETCKHILSTIGSAQCFVESVYEGIDLNISISRARFESLINPLLSNCMQPVIDLLKKAKIHSDDIRKLVLAGGSCKIPKIQQFISDLFPSTELLSHISSDEVIAVGASKQGACIQDEGVEVIEKDCYINALSRGIGVKVLGSDNESKFEMTLLPKGTPIPAISKRKSLPGIIPRTSLEIYEEPEGDDSDKERLLSTISVPCKTTEEFFVAVLITKDRTLELNFSGSSFESKMIKIKLRE